MSRPLRPLALLATLTAALTFIAPAVAQEGFPVAPGTGLPPLEAAAAMSLPQGFKATLFAGEPDVHQPIAFTLDERGRLWVVENYSYPNWSPYGHDRILIMEDTNGDGAFDTSKVFFDQLNFATGIAVGHGGVWVGSPPYLLFIPDKNQDDEPDDVPTVVLDGWGSQDLHETLNSFVWGPDGWLYGNQGIFTHSNVGVPGAKDNQRTPLNACIWRYHPTKKIFEIFAEGMSNQWGLDFNDVGDAFVTACVIPHLYHVVQGGHYHRQAGQHFNPYTYGDIQTIGDHLHYDTGVKWSDARFGAGGTDAAGGGHAHAGTLIYLGDSFPAEYRDTLFTHNILGNRINRDRPEPSGSGYIGRHAPDFMLANDGWFRGLRLELGPDGSIFGSDWYDARACHQQRPQDRSNGRIYKYSYGTKPFEPIDLKKLPSAELVKLQLHPNEWHVRRSRLILQERGFDAGVHTALTDIIRTHPDATRQLRALWALHVTGGLTNELALEFLQSSTAHVRAWTVQLTCEDQRPSTALLARFTTLAQNDPSPVVRRFLASAAQRIKPANRWSIVEALLTHAEDATDHNLPLLYWFAAEPLVPLDPVRALAMGQSTPIASIRPYFTRRQAEAAATTTGSAGAKNQAGMMSLISALAESTDPAYHLEVLGSLLTATEGQKNLTPPDTWGHTYAKLSASRDPAVVEKADALAARFGDRTVFRTKQAIVSDSFAPLSARQTALRVLADRRDFQQTPLFQSLLTEPGLRLGALRALAPYDVPTTPPAILKAYSSFSTPEKSQALAVLTQRISYAQALLDAIDQNIVPASHLDASLLRQLRLLDDPEITKRVDKIGGAQRAMPDNAVAAIGRWKSELTPERIRAANPRNGKTLFTQTCASCHVLFAEGHELGPELTGSNRADLDYLLANIVEPNGTIGRDYLLTLIETNDGRNASGIVKRETATAVTLANTAETVTFATSEIKSLRRLEVSLMPPGLLDALSKSEVADLVAYLQSMTPLE
jgi:putative membrane-bound dehydrogenase-like protein